MTSKSMQKRINIQQGKPMDALPNNALDIILDLDIECVFDNYQYQFIKKARQELIDLRQQVKDLEKESFDWKQCADKLYGDYGFTQQVYIDTSKKYSEE